MTASPTGSSSRSFGWGLNHPLVDARPRRGHHRRRRPILGLRLGSEFVPRLNEGSVVINTIRLASVSLEESLRYGTQIEGYPQEEVPRRDRRHLDQDRECRGRDRPDGPGALRHLHHAQAPRASGRKAKTQEELVAAMAQATKVLPGMRAVYTQPIEMRINEMVAGIRSDLGIKLYGEDLETLKAKAAEIEKVVKTIPGAADTTTEQVTGLPVLRINVDNEALSRYGVPAEAVLDAIKAVGRHRRRRGHRAGQTLPARRAAARWRTARTRNALEQILIPTATGQRLPLTQLARLEETDGPIDHPTRLGRASHHRADERAGPRHRARSSRRPRSESAAR